MKIIGEKKPIIGVTEMYSVIDSNGVLFTSNMNKVTYAWYIFKKYKNGAFVNVTKNNIPKTGQSVPYSFGYNVEYRLDVYKLEKELLTQKDKASFVASYFVNPTKKSSKAEIKKVVIYNKGAKNVDLAGVGNTLTVRVECINMVNKQVKVHVWNAENKNESNFLNVDIKSQPNFMNSRLIDINEKGIGLTQFNVMQLLSPTESMNLMIGNIKAIGLFVTATYEQQSVTNKAPVVVVSQFQSIADIFESARSMSSYNDIDASESTESCGGKYCIKKGDKNELIREVNIRLAGFGGNVPTDEFTDRTEKMIKQFQRDYMKVEETGKICGNVLKAIDEFSNKCSEKILTYKCLCHASDSKVKISDRCKGYGKGLKNEHPGVHRTLLWGVSALKFYLSKQIVYKYLGTTAGYRCWAHNNSIPRKSTNHMGKAVDIQFTENNNNIIGKFEKNLTPLRKIRDNFYIKYLKAEEGWSIPSKNNNYRLEPIGVGKDESYSWIHLDVSLFKPEFLKDAFFVKEQNLIINTSIVQLAIELGFTNTCSCGGDFSIVQKQKTTITKRVDPKTLKVSQKGIEFIKSFEKIKEKAYNDSEGYATIGIGYLVAYKKVENITKEDVEKTEITWEEFKNGISNKKALELFYKKIELYEKAIYRDITVPLYQHEFDAIASLVFNGGQNFLKEGMTKAPKLRKNLMDENYEAAAVEFLDITNKGTPGLEKRRKYENNMFLNNIYEYHK